MEHGQSAPASKRLLETLERLLELPGAELESTLVHACDFIAGATGADKVDAFLYDATRDSLVAVGSSNQPLSALQKRLGLDVLPLSNGGRVVHVFQTGQTFVTGRLDDDPDELRGVREGLRIRSTLGVPLTVAGVRRGLIMVASLAPDFFSEDDVRFAETVARWTAIVAHRAELVQDISRNAAEHGRRAAAEELVTVIAHDLRNLVAPIDLRLHLLRRRAHDDARAEDIADLDVIQRGLRRLGAMVADILDVARIDQGLFTGAREPTDVVALIEEIARRLESPSHPVVLGVQSTGAVMVAADAERLRQCLENLIGNAIQKSPKDAQVEVRVATQRREDGEWALVEVIDQGPGIPEEIRPHIFERFVKGADREGGLGLGLYLAKHIATMHGGELTFDAGPRTGARFILTLPCAEPR